jgi:hypothetical protein
MGLMYMAYQVQAGLLFITHKHVNKSRYSKVAGRQFSVKRCKHMQENIFTNSEVSETKKVAMHGVVNVESNTEILEERGWENEVLAKN